MRAPGARERVLELMADGTPRTIRRIAYELNLGLSTVRTIVREGLLVEVARERKTRDAFPHPGQPIVLPASLAREWLRNAPTGDPTRR